MMTVDSFRYLPPLIERYYKLTRVPKELPIPWTPLAKPINRSRFGLVTSGGLYHKGYEPPFNLEGEKREPSWGDPSYRTIHINVQPEAVGVSHFHINGQSIEKDINVLLPIQRMQTLVESGQISGLVDRAYSFMGYQGFPPDLGPWREQYGPEVAKKLLADGADCVLLTAA